MAWPNKFRYPFKTCIEYHYKCLNLSCKLRFHEEGGYDGCCPYKEKTRKNINEDLKVRLDLLLIKVQKKLIQHGFCGLKLEIHLFIN